MNRSLALLLMSLISLTTPLLAERATLPHGSQGEVTLDWPKFQEIWTKMQEMGKRIEELEKPENLPPVPFTITQAAYKGSVGDKQTRLTAVFELDVYDPKQWVKVPFLPSNVAIMDARLNGQPVGVIQDGGFHQILLRKPGRYSLQVQVSLRSPKPEEAPQLSFNLVPTPITLLSLEFARPKLDVVIEPSQGIDVQSSGDRHTRVTASLPPTSYVSVRWQKALTEEAAGPAKLYLDSQYLFSASEGTLKARWSLNYTVLRNGIKEIKVLLPAEWNLLSVSVEGLQEWKTVDSPKGPMLLVQLAYARKGQVELILQMERALGEKEDVLDLPRLRAIDVEREQGTVGIEAKGAVELQVAGAEGLQPMDPRELPGGLWRSAAQPILFAFRFTKPHALTLSVKRHPETPVLTTTVDDANAVSVLTARGQLITKIRYQVRNQLKQYLGVRLPEGADLWSVFVAGVPVKPTRAEDGSYRIPLANSQLGDAGQQGFPVELIFYRQAPKFRPIGLRTLTLPMPDAPVSRMWWSLYVPENYRFPYFGGDVEKGPAASLWNGLAGNARLDATGLTESAGSVVDKKEKQGLRDEFRGLARKMMGAPKTNEGDRPYEVQSAVADSLFQAKDVMPTQSGVFPVAFELPASGQLFTFGQIMVVGQSPTLTIGFLHAAFVKGSFVILLACLGIALYRRRSALFPYCRILLPGA